MTGINTTDIKRIGILTGGGDCPGLNAVIRAVTKTAIFDYGLEVIGIEDGFLGLVEGRVHPLDEAATSGILTRGGTILGSNNKCNPSRFAVQRADGGYDYIDVTGRCLDHLEQFGIDALVVIGGDGTMACAQNFVERGVTCVGVPKTIDNDLVGTDVTFGFATAVNTATEAIDRIHTTAMSHHRAMVVEVMGRNAGWISLYAGMAGTADVILIPEFLPVSAIHAALARGRRVIYVPNADWAEIGAKISHSTQEFGQPLAYFPNTLLNQGLCFCGCAAGELERQKIRLAERVDSAVPLQSSLDKFKDQPSSCLQVLEFYIQIAAFTQEDSA